MPEAQDIQGRVLIIEDDPCYQRLLERYLQRCGVSVGFAENGRLGLEKLLSGRYDIAFVDIQLPELDGFMVATMCREQGCEIPLIGMSAFRLEEMPSKAAAVGFNSFTFKPVSEHIVTQLLNKHLQPAEHCIGE